MTFVDSVIFIDFAEGDARLKNQARQLFERGVPITASDLAKSEVLVHPIRSFDVDLLLRYEVLFGLTTFLPVSETVLYRVAELRAAIPGLKTPDAIHAATALVHQATEFVTRDPGFRRVPGLNVTLLT